MFVHVQESRLYQAVAFHLRITYLSELIYINDYELCLLSIY